MEVGGIGSDGTKNQSRGRIVMHIARRRVLGQTVEVKQKKGVETEYLGDGLEE